MAYGYKEHRERLPADMEVVVEAKGLSQKWTFWELVMGPEGTDELELPRDGIGSWADPRFDNRCGIYEIGLLKPGGDLNDLEVVYVGSSCRYNYKNCMEHDTSDCQMCGLKDRIIEYCVDGSHKAEEINKALASGMQIFVRCRYVKSGITSRQEMQRISREAEDSLLRQWDYAWNIRGNDKTTTRSPDGILSKYKN